MKIYNPDKHSTQKSRSVPIPLRCRQQLTSVIIRISQDYTSVQFHSSYLADTHKNTTNIHHTGNNGLSTARASSANQNGTQIEYAAVASNPQRIVMDTRSGL